MTLACTDAKNHIPVNTGTINVKNPYFTSYHPENSLVTHGVF